MNNNIKFLKINLKDTNHINYILKLSKRNHFYEKYINRDINCFKELEINIGWLVVLNSKVIGFLIYKIGDDKMCDLHYILIDKLFQHKGYGTQILKYFIDYAESTSDIHIVILKNDTKSNFYKRNGFIKQSDINLTIEFESISYKLYEILYYVPTHSPLSFFIK
jgi:GNAT superfamily N-acetyltransferase